METEYIKIGITKTILTDLYLKVPKGWKLGQSLKYKKLLVQAAEETLTDLDWDDYGWQNSIGVESISLVSEDEAEQFKVFDIT